MTKLTKSIFLGCFLILTSCGGGGGPNSGEVKIISDYYAKTGEVAYCFEYGLNDNDEVTLKCSILENLESSYVEKIYKLNSNGKLKEYPLPRALTAEESLTLDTIKPNGKFFVSINKFIPHHSSNLKNKSQKTEISTISTVIDSSTEYFIWNGQSYDEIDENIIASSDNGRFFSQYSNNFDSSSKQILIADGKEIELKSNDGAFPFQIVYRVTNKGEQYGPGYNAIGEISLDNLIWSEKGQRVLQAPIDSSGKRTYQLAYVNNNDSALYYTYSNVIDEANKAQILIQHKDGSIYNKDLDLPESTFLLLGFNDNNLAIVGDYTNEFIFSTKSGLKNIKDFIDPNDTTTSYDIRYLNNNNKVLVNAYYADGANKTLLVDLGDF